MSDPQFTVVRPALIFLGSGLGGLLRYGFGSLLQGWWGPGFPIGTMTINVTGCLVMGCLVSLWSGPGLLNEELRDAVLIGVLGGYTTFSSFGRDTLILADRGEYGRMSLYITGSVLLSLLAVRLGVLLAGGLRG